MVEQKNPVGKKPEHDGLYDKITAYGTIASVVVAVIGLFISLVVLAIGYLTLAYTAHWAPFNSTPSASPSTSASNSASAQATAPSGQSANAVPADFQGDWQGVISGPAGSFEASMSLSPGSVGSQVGVFNNDGGKCQAEIFLTSGGGPLGLRLVTTSNPFDACVWLAFAHATLTSGGIDFSFDPGGDVEPGDGTLTSAG